MTDFTFNKRRAYLVKSYGERYLVFRVPGKGNCVNIDTRYWITGPGVSDSLGSTPLHGPYDNGDKASLVACALNAGYVACAANIKKVLYIN